MYDKKILIVDDSGSMRGMLEEILIQAGFVNIIMAVNGEDALTAMHKHHPDLILLDVIMPVMNGMTALKEIGTQTKVMILSAVGQDSIIKEAKNLGALDFLVKPLDRDDVVKKVTRCLE